MVLENLCERITRSVRRDPERIAFTFLDYPSRSHGRTTRTLSIGQIDSGARVVADRLKGLVARGEPVLLLFSPGPDFVSGFIGCLYAGAVAIPVPTPRAGATKERLRSVLRDSGATVAVGTSASRAICGNDAGLLSGLTWLSLDGMDLTAPPCAAPTELQEADSEAVAILQYSSGSTGNPKGVMLSHANLINQAATIFSEMGAVAGECWVGWLPYYHDMGLLSEIVAPLAHDIHSVMMPPEAFVSRPERWLHALSEYGGTACASPNFGYELCVRKCQDHVLTGVDLSKLRVAVIGAEPVRAATMERFTRRFGRYGFDGKAFYPAYGLAEATLLVSGRAGSVRVGNFRTESLEDSVVRLDDDAQTNATRLVSSGRPPAGNVVRIVEPNTLTVLPEMRVGEVWVAGASVGLGYWRAAEQSKDTFGVTLAGDGCSGFLRTGDLGFMADGELYVRGRIKDLLVIHGSNHHASDIEATVETCNPDLVPSGGAAFSVDVADEERLVVVHELERRGEKHSDADLAAIASAIRAGTFADHQISPYDVILLDRGLPRTSSGKVRRKECRRRYLSGDLKYVYRSLAADSVATSVLPTADGRDSAPQERQRCENWLLAQISVCAPDIGEVAGADDSISAVAENAEAMKAIIGQIRRSYGLSVPFSAFVDHPTVGDLAAYICNAVDAQRAFTGRREEKSTAADRARESAWPSRAAREESIAVIGMACRFPSADDPRQFWEILRKGVDVVTEVPPERWDAEALYDPNPVAIGKMCTRRGGFLKNVEGFDAQFFGIPKREATRMDPAHRVLLELSWEAFEDAGILPAEMSGRKIGVFIGISGSDYAQVQFGDDLIGDPYAGVGCALTNAASRISHFHNLLGPALAVDTACSSALSALHIGAMAVRAGDCEMAIVGGVNIILAPNITISLSKAGMMAPDGRCKTFDKDANGYVRSEGAGLLLLKPLSAALADGDSIYAVVLGSATNQDGGGTSISAPNGEAQQRVIRSACERAGIKPTDLDYVEAHGTGTALGDPIEANALGELLKADGNAAGCAIGSVKTNIGHCEAAAGVAALIKASLVLHNREIPASLNLSEPNPLISFQDYNLRVQTSLGPLPDRDRPRLVGVNSFGIGGTNVHVVLEEWPSDSRHGTPNNDGRSDGSIHVVPISGRTESGLKANAAKLAEHFREHGDRMNVQDACRTLAVHRTHFRHRLCVVGSNVAEMAEALDTFATTGHHPEIVAGTSSVTSGPVSSIAFVYSGQSPHWKALGLRLYALEEAYREELKRVDAQLFRYTGWSVIDVLAADGDKSLLEDTAYVQPVCFAVQCALTALLRSWGIVPTAVIGHSVGEVAAAYVSGAIGFRDACRLVAARGRLMSRVQGSGTMVNVPLPREALKEIISEHGSMLSIAASNSPDSSVLSGPRDAVARVIDGLADRGVSTIDLGVDYAFHNAQFAGAAAQLVEEMGDLDARQPEIPLMSTVCAAWVDGGREIDAAYWGDNVLKEVRFAEGVTAMSAAGSRVFVEIGSHPVLLGAICRTLRVANADGSAIATLVRDVDEARAMRRCAGSLHAAGAGLDWRALSPCGRFARGLPHYAWQRSRYWIDAPHHEARKRLGSHPLVTIRMPVSTATWQSRLDPVAHPYIQPVRIRGRGLVSNGLYIELALEAAAQAGRLQGRPELVNLRFRGQLNDISGGSLTTLESSVAPHADGRLNIYIRAQTERAANRAESWQAVFESTAVTAGSGDGCDPGAPSLDGIRARNELSRGAVDAYRKLSEIGVEYERIAQVAVKVGLGTGSALLQVKFGEIGDKREARYHLHPLGFEAMEQACRMASEGSLAHCRLHEIGRLRVFGQLHGTGYAYAEVHGTEEGLGGIEAKSRVDVWLLREDGSVAALAEGLVFVSQRQSRADPRGAGISADTEDWRYVVEWQSDGDVPSPSESQASSGRWLIFADERGIADGMAGELTARGQTCTLVRAGEKYARSGTRTWTVGVVDGCDVERLVTEQFLDGGDAYRGVVYLWGLDAAPAIDGCAIPAGYTAGVSGLVDVVRAVSLVDVPRAPRLWIVTSNAQAVGGDTTALSATQSMLWGCAKSIVHEHAELRCSRADLSSEPNAAEIRALCDDLLAERLDDQIALRNGVRFVAKLAHGKAESSIAPGEPDHAGEPNTAQMSRFLLNSKSGRGIERKYERRRSPDAGQIELAVHAAVIDVDNKEGAVSAQAAAGTVIQVGDGVTKFQAGQRAIVVGNLPFASHSLVAARAAAVLPDALTLQTAAQFLPMHIAALFALRDVARIKAGDCVLVRMDNGSDGLPVVRMAKALGAKVLVVAPRRLHQEIARFDVKEMCDETDVGSLETMSFGVGHGGADVLVNAAPQLAASRCLRRLRALGRCIDLRPALGGQEEAVCPGLPANVCYYPICVDTIRRHDPVGYEALLDDAIVYLGKLAAAYPERPALRAEALANALGEESGYNIAVQLDASTSYPAGPYQGEATYLITGGLGGLGLRIARRMVREGARYIVLVGRRGPSLAAMDVINELKGVGVNCVTMRADVADPGSLSNVLERIRRELPPLRGVIHAAGVLENTLISQMSHEQVRAVMPAKVEGAWNLHNATQQDSLQFFVLFSSLASFIGSPGQANYAAANAFLEALAERRKGAGLPALAIAWGPWSEVGMAADVHNLERLVQHGMGMIAPEFGLNLLDDLIARGASGAIGALPMNWDDWAKTRRHAAQTTFFAGLMSDGGEERRITGKIGKESLVGKTTAERLEMLASVLKSTVAKCLVLEPEAVDIHAPLTALGLDSIVALELKDRIESSIDVVVRTNALIAGKSIYNLAEQFVEELGSDDSQPERTAAASKQRQEEPPGPVDDNPDQAMIEKLGRLSDDQVDAMLKELTASG